MRSFPRLLLVGLLTAACAPPETPEEETPCSQRPVSIALALYAPSLGDLAYAGCQGELHSESGGTPRDHETFTYNDAGQRVSMRTWDPYSEHWNRITWTLDDQGRVVSSQTDRRSDGNIEGATEWDYDPEASCQVVATRDYWFDTSEEPTANEVLTWEDGLLVAIDRFVRGQTEPERSTVLDYDGDTLIGMSTQVANAPVEQFTSLDHDDQGRVSSLTWTTSDDPDGYSYVYTWDADDRLVHEQRIYNINDQVSYDRTYTRDDGREVSSVLQEDGLTITYDWTWTCDG